MKNKLLSICIPTYNGAKYIRKNIDTILEQINEYNLKDVEIVVSDNCSTDDIPKIMMEYSTKFPDIIKYSRNDENLGYDGNVMKCCAIASGKFVHLFGDDDYYAPEGLLRLHSVLEKEQELSVLVLSNLYLRDDNFQEIVTRKNLNEKFFIEDRKYIKDPDNFIMDIEDRAWPNTNLVFRKDYFYQIPNLNQFYKKDWIHLYILLYLAKNGKVCYLFADKYPIVVDRVGVQKWLNNSDGPRIYFNNLWTYSFANTLGYSKKVFNWYRRKLLSEYIKNIEFRRSENLLVNLKYVLKYFKYYWDVPSFYFVFIPKFLFYKFPSQIFSIRNKYHHSRKIKEKVFTFCFIDTRIAIKRVHTEFMNLNLPPKALTFYNKNGQYFQVVPSYLLDEMIDYIVSKGLLYKYKTFYRHLNLGRKQKYIYYSTYIKFIYCFQHIVKKLESQRKN